MQVVNSPTDLQLKGKGSYIAIGKWDGIHLGHQQLIKHIVKGARESHCQSIVISFDRHPLSVLKPGNEPYQIQSVQDRTETLKRLDVDVHLILPFTREFASLSPESFVTSVLTKLNACEVMIGYNFRFGKNRRGTPELLRTICVSYGISVKVAQPIYMENERISSTLIRSYLQSGEVETARKLLGRPAVFEGRLHPVLLSMNNEVSLFEISVDPSNQFLCSGAYVVKVNGQLLKGSSKGFLLVQKDSGIKRHFLLINKKFSLKSFDFVRIQLLNKAKDDKHLEGFLWNNDLIQDFLEMPVVNF